MRIIARTDPGKVRSSNQDSYAAGEFRNGVAWAVVCDGMGGSVGGNIASSTAVRSISERITTAYRENMSSSSIRNLLVTAITNANFEIFDMASANPDLTGMGTTVVAAIMDDENIYVAHAGDSRAYVISKSSIRQITRDHSVVQKMIENGEITEAEAVRHPSKNLITRALGVDENLRVDFNEEPCGERTMLLICTDGLTNYVTDEEIHQTILKGLHTDFAETLVDLANEHGGGDNITVVAVEG